MTQENRSQADEYLARWAYSVALGPLSRPQDPVELRAELTAMPHRKVELDYGQYRRDALLVSLPDDSQVLVAEPLEPRGFRQPYLLLHVGDPDGMNPEDPVYRMDHSTRPPAAVLQERQDRQERK